MKNYIGIAAVLLFASTSVLADDFFDFPRYPGAEVTEQDSYGSVHNMTLSTKDELDKVTAFYKTAPHIEWCKVRSDTYTDCRFVNKEAKGVVGLERKSYGVTVIDVSVSD